MIVQLKLAVEQKEHQIQQIMVDKKYYQMELVNRETNYNKVFNSNPNVGVLNPRAATKKKKNGSMKVPSANYQSKADGRLEPLSRHSSPINSPMQPPPLPKKVVRWKTCLWHMHANKNFLSGLHTIPLLTTTCGMNIILVWD